MTDDGTARLLDRFVHGLRTEIAPRAVWAHGSLAGGDYQEGRSDLDLVAVLDAPADRAVRRRVARLHTALDATYDLAARLHCTYLDPGALEDPAVSHLTWAHRELMERPVTEVTRRELHGFGTVLDGPAPAGLLPEVTDAALCAFVVRDQRDYWRPALERSRRWRQDIWVDLGLLTHARATVTLREGRLIPKGEALDVLAELGAPPEVVADVRQRRYGPPDGQPGRDTSWPERRAGLTRTFLRQSVDALVAEFG